MGPDTWEKVFIGLGGGAAAAVGAWVNEWRSERKRKAAKLEEAYITWLNSYTGVLGQLKQLAQLAEREPESSEEQELMFEKLDRVNVELKGLLCALNTAMLYERKLRKRAAVEFHSMRYTLLIDTLTVLIRHHRGHLEYRETNKRGHELLDVVEKALASDAAKQAPEIEKDLVKCRKSVQQTIKRGEKHLANCSACLSDDAKAVSKTIADIEKEAPLLRHELAR